MSDSPWSNSAAPFLQDEPPTHGVVVARILEVRPHPNAAKIRLATIDLGDGSKHQVVYGGDRELRSGDLVPAAPPGTRLPGKKKMRRQKFRGQSSFGMLCSSDELGWTIDGPDEVALLLPTLEVGQSLDSSTAKQWLLSAHLAAVSD